MVGYRSAMGFVPDSHEEKEDRIIGTDLNGVLAVWQINFVCPLLSFRVRFCDGDHLRGIFNRFLIQHLFHCSKVSSPAVHEKEVREITLFHPTGNEL